MTRLRWNCLKIYSWNWISSKRWLSTNCLDRKSLSCSSKTLFFILWAKFSFNHQFSILRVLSQTRHPLCPSFSCSVQVPILSVICLHSPKRKKWILDSRCYLWVKAKVNLHVSLYQMGVKMVIGYVCKTAIWLLVGCLPSKRFKRTKCQSRHILIIDFGLPLCPANHSQFLSYRAVSRSPTSHPRVLKQTFFEAITISQKRPTSVALRLKNLSSFSSL